MRILLDEDLPRRLGSKLIGHEVSTVQRSGWSGVKNGKLLVLAATQFDAFLTMDSNLEHQLNLAALPIAVLVIQAASNRIDLAATVHRVRRQPSQGSPAASCRSPSRSLRSTKHRFVVHFDNTTTWCHTANGVKATLLVRRRIEYADNRFAEVVVWILDRPLPGSKHLYKYRLAYVVDEVCVLRFDNEAGKGDHRHMGDQEFDYLFRSIEALLSDFERNVRRLNDEDGYT